MFAIAFDLVVSDIEQHHPKSVAQAYRDIAKVLDHHGFRRVQGSVYLTDNEDGEPFPGDHGASNADVAAIVCSRYPRISRSAMVGLHGHREKRNIVGWVRRSTATP